MDVLGVVTTLAVAPPTAMHLSIGGAVASVGINVVMMISFSLLTWWTMGDADFESDLEMPGHAPGQQDAGTYPLPEYLREAGYENSINIGIFGVTGSGKSSLVNALRRRKPGDPGAAPVGVEETTNTPTPYSLVDADVKLPEDVIQGIGTDVEKKRNTRPVRIWDLPGAGTCAFPSSCCVREMGLRYFDVVVLVVAGRMSTTDIKVAHELENFKVPAFIVRSQVDTDIENEAEDYGTTGEEVQKKLRLEMASQGFSHCFLVSSRKPDSYDFQQLSNSIVASVQAKRRVHKDENCPICFEMFDKELRKAYCHWCCNVICSSCASQLQGKLDETPCPFCRRWITFQPLDNK
mmetsp:Transcript_2998/g.5980  ORF Transcript_2998/g.5980 Transcript_2998/m.5980 type:complete len:349 (+) Transcript_2998:175-1221(+)